MYKGCEMSEKIRFIIDGVEIEAEKNQTILEAAEANGIYIPRLCYHKDLVPFGSCRVCTVLVNGRLILGDTTAVSGRSKGTLFMQNMRQYPIC